MRHNSRLSILPGVAISHSLIYVFHTVQIHCPTLQSLNNIVHLPSILDRQANEKNTTDFRLRRNMTSEISCLTVCVSIPCQDSLILSLSLGLTVGVNRSTSRSMSLSWNLSCSLSCSLSWSLTCSLTWNLSWSLTLSPSQTASSVVRQALPDIEGQLWLPGSADSDMLALPQGRSSHLHLLQRQAHEFVEQVPKNGCVHAHLHDAVHAATHQLVLKLLQDDCTHGVVVLRQQMVVHTACMYACTTHFE